MSKIQVIAQIAFMRNLINPGLNDDGSKKAPDVLLRIPKNVDKTFGHNDLIAAVRLQANEHFKAKGKPLAAVPAGGHPLHGIPQMYKTGIKDGDIAGLGQKLEETMRDHWFFNVKFNDGYGIVGPKIERLTVKDLYSGCWIRVYVRVSPIKHPSTVGVTFWSDNIQFLQHGERLGATAQTAEQEFDEFKDLSMLPEPSPAPFDDSDVI